MWLSVPDHYEPTLFDQYRRLYFLPRRLNGWLSSTVFGLAVAPASVAAVQFEIVIRAGKMV